MVDVSIIIVSYNTAELLENCINSIVEKTQNISYEVIVVDNDSCRQFNFFVVRKI